ncbi:MAG: SH3 domain-containing protein [Hominilimicola sp.]
MKFKGIIAAVITSAISFTFAANTFADNNTLYCCAYYDADNKLVYVKNIRSGITDEDISEYVNYYQPENAVKSKVYKWDNNMKPEQPAADIALTTATDNFDSTFKAPNTTSELCSADFWINNGNASDELVLTYSEITRLNQNILDTEAASMTDLTSLPETYNGKEMSAAAANFSSPTGHYLNGEIVEESYYQAIRDNIANADVSESMPLKYGICVNRTVMKVYPYSDYLSDSPTDPEWDDFVSSAVYVNEPLAVYYTTADGEFTLVQSTLCSGWVPTADIAICKDKEEWTAATCFENKLVVTGEKIYLEDSADSDLSQKMLTMGTVLELDTEHSSAVANRLPWNNYVVKMPARNEDGSFYHKYAMIPANRDVNVGYLPYTTANVLRQAFKSLGNRYGWGGMMNAQDCSSFALEVYKCFGINIPRNTTWQAQMPVEVTSLSEMADDEKKEFLDNLPAGSILQFPGHEMIYLGSHGGLYYTINNVSSLVSPDEPGIVIRPRGVVVNDLSTLRGNGTTWLNNLSRAITVR